MESVLKLINDSRLLAAKNEYENIMKNKQLAAENSQNILENRRVIDQMLDRCTLVDQALDMVNKSNENWKLATNLLGVTTHYQLGDDGYLWVRMESTSHDVPLMEQLAVVYEVGLFNTWIPFCTESSLIKRLNHVEVISYSAITALGICRDVLVHSFGVDCLYETGSIVVIGSSIVDPEKYPGIDIPPQKGYFSSRALLEFNAVVTPFSPTSGHVS
jgi:hypothetical protein